MKKNFKVVQLNGLSGIIILLLTLVAVFFMLVAAPVYAIKYIWNSFDIQNIRLSQASLLWGAFLCLIYAYLRRKICFKFVNGATLSDNCMPRADYEKFLEEIKKEEEKENEKINR